MVLLLPEHTSEAIYIVDFVLVNWFPLQHDCFSAVVVVNEAKLLPWHVAVSRTKQRKYLVSSFQGGHCVRNR